MWNRIIKTNLSLPDSNEVPEEYYKKCAERCWFAEEAFNLEGVNKFNKVLISEQLAEIRLHKRGPRPEAGYIDYFYKNNKYALNDLIHVQVLIHHLKYLQN